MTLREEVVNLSGNNDTLNEEIIAGLIALGALAGITIGSAAIKAWVDRLKIKKWEKIKRMELLKKRAYRSENKIAFGFDIDRNHFKTYILPSEGYLMKFNEQSTVIGFPSGKTYTLDEYKYGKFEESLGEEITKKYKELIDNLRLPEDNNIKKLLDEKLSVEFYCRGIITFTERQKNFLEKAIRKAVEDAGFKKFKLKIHTGA